MPDYTGQKFIIEGQDDGVAIGATDSFAIGEVTATGRVTEVTFIPEAAVTGDNTNKRVYTLVNKNATGGGTTVIATLDLITGNNLVAFDEKTAVLGVAANLVATEGDTLAWTSTFAGTGLIDPGGVVKVTIERAAA